MSVAGKDWKGSFCFIQGADTQFGAIEDFLEKKPEPKWDKEIALTKLAVQNVNRMNPKPLFFIVCGDLVNAFPGTKDRRAQESDFQKVFSELDPDIPLVCVCGNHDIGNTPTPASIDVYRNVFGADYFSFWVGGVHCIVINSQYYKDPSLVKEMLQEQDDWLDLELKKTGYQHRIVLQHIPWFLHESEEEEEYFNLGRELRLSYLEKFRKNGVKSVFCGHYHRNAGGFYRELDCPVTSAIGAQIGNDGSGLRVVSVTEDEIKHKYYRLEDIPVTVNL